MTDNDKKSNEMKESKGTRRVRADTVTLGGGDSTIGQGSADSSDVAGGSTTGITKCITAKMLRTGVQADKYVYVDEIGRGGMGSVLRVYDSNLRRHVAMKRILASTGERIRLRFVEEAQITGQLEHPHIVPVHEIGRDPNDRLYFTMKLVRGDTLSDILNKVRDDEKSAERYSLGHLLHAFINVCHAIDFAHSRGVIHRDIKPDNIMLGQFGEVQVMDWGLAKARSVNKGQLSPEKRDEVSVSDESKQHGEFKQSSEPIQKNFAKGVEAEISPIESVRGDNSPNITMDGQILGTLAYMPPEQARGENDKVDERSDIYSLGVILYEILTLEIPVSGKNNEDFIRKICRGSFQRPIERSPERSIPSELDAVVMKALERSRDNRYQSVKDLRIDIELYLSGRSVSAKRDSVTEAMKKFFLRNKAVSSVVIVSCIAIVMLGLFSGTQQRRADLAQTEVDRLEQERVDSSTRVWYEIHQEQFDSQRISEHWDLYVGWDTPSQTLAADAIGQYLSNDPDGMHVVSSEKQLTMLYREPVVGDVKMTYEVKWLGGDEGGFHAIIHGNGWQEGYIFQLGGWGNTRSAILRANNNGLTELASSPFTLVVGELYAVEARKVGQVLSLFVNGEMILEVAERREDVLAGGPYRHCGFVSGSNSETVYHNVGIYKYGASKAVDLLDVADRFMLNANYQTARDVYQEVFESLTSRERKQRARIGLEKAKNLLNLEDVKERYIDILSKKWKDLDPKLWVERQTLQLDLRGKDITDISILRGMELQRLNLAACSGLVHIGALREMPLLWLDISGTAVQDMRPLRGMDLKHLNAAGSKIQANSTYILRGMPLETLNLSRCDVRNINFMKGSTTIQHLNISHTGVKDISQLGLLTLRSLDVSGNPLRDISPLFNVPLVELNVAGSEVTRIEVLRDMVSLRILNLSALSISDFSPLQTLLLEELYMDNMHFDDLSHLEMLPLHTLSIAGTEVTDLTPLAHMNLHFIRFSPKNIDRGIDVLRYMSNLEKIAVDDSPPLSAQEFWKEWDAAQGATEALLESPEETIPAEEE